MTFVSNIRPKPNTISLYDRCVVEQLPVSMRHGRNIAFQPNPTCSAMATVQGQCPGLASGYLLQMKQFHQAENYINTRSQAGKQISLVMAAGGGEGGGGL